MFLLLLAKLSDQETNDSSCIFLSFKLLMPGLICDIDEPLSLSRMLAPLLDVTFMSTLPSLVLELEKDNDGIVALAPLLIL